MWPNSQETENLVTLTEEIFTGINFFFLQWMNTVDSWGCRKVVTPISLFIINTPTQLLGIETLPTQLKFTSSKSTIETLKKGD